MMILNDNDEVKWIFNHFCCLSPDVYLSKTSTIYNDNEMMLEDMSKYLNNTTENY